MCEFKFKKALVLLQNTNSIQSAEQKNAFIGCVKNEFIYRLIHSNTL